MTYERLKHLASVTISNVDKKSSDGEIPVRLCNYTDVYYNDQITSALDFMSATARPEQLLAFRLAAGDVVLTKDSETPDDIGISAFVAETIPDLVCGYHLAIARPRQGRLDGRFLRWVLTATPSRQRMASLATGVTRFGLRGDAISDLPIPVPSLPTQRAIADYLDRETARIDALIAAKKAMMALLEEHWGALLDRVVWAGVSKVSPLKYLVEPRRPIMYGIVLPGPDVGEGGHAIVKGGDVAARRLSWAKLCKTTPEIEAPFARARLRPGDLVIAIRGGIGDVAMVPPEAEGANITQDVARIAPAPGVSATWLAAVLRSPRVRYDIARRVTGATVKGLNIWELDRLTVPAASMHRQKEDEMILGPERERLDGLQLALQRQTALLIEHRQVLITAAVSGKLGVPEAA